ncbi:response regulator [Vibrio sp. S4M6]|uniref:ATP-binding protein n=1 Tax=Vibrio sinus TaxID=2946865 RepID=UPI002029E5DF|nr:ATP-binding protein [Vibrio sinus]MCL9783332.1 response regulator [Vibrio sinus]
MDISEDILSASYNGESTSLPSVNILLVDDSQDDRELIRRRLDKVEDTQYHIVESASGAHIIELLSAHRPHCVLLDYSMPGEDGLQVLNKITEHAPFTPVILFSGQGSERVAVAAIKAGAFHYLRKSELTSELLCITIEQGMRKKQLEHTLFEQNQEIARHQNALIESKERYDKVAQATGIVVWEYDIDQAIFYVDKQLYILLGWPYAQDSLSLHAWQSLVHPDDTWIYQTHWDNCLVGELAHCEATIRLRCFDNTYCWVRMTGNVTLRGKRGEPLKIAGLLEDVSAKKQEELALNDFYALTLNSQLSHSDKVNQLLKLGVQYFGLDIGLISHIEEDCYQVLHCEPEGYITSGQFFGYEETYCSYVFGSSEVKAWHDAASCDMSAHPWFQKQELSCYIGTTVLVNGEPYGTLSFLKKSPRQSVFTEQEKMLLRLMAQWLGSEITRQHNLNALQESKDFLSLMQESIPDYIFVKDETYRIVQANEAFLSLYPDDIRDTVIGSTTIESYSEDEAREFLANDRQALQVGYSEVEETIRFPNEATRILQTKKVRFTASNGKRFILGIARDITEIKQSHVEVLRSNQELERFAYIVSHDLQEPLRMVANFTELLEKHYSDEFDERGLEFMGYIVGGASRMQELVKSLLTYARVGHSAENIESVDLNNLKETIESNLFESIKQTNAIIEWPASMPTITATPARMLSVFQNLIGNAIKYRKSFTTPHIIISVDRQLDNWVFCIKDNGIGMKQEYSHKIFEPFKRLCRKEEYAGTGMGLAICRQVIEELGGRIWVTTSLGQGSLFYFSVPQPKHKRKE